MHLRSIYLFFCYFISYELFHVQNEKEELDTKKFELEKKIRARRFDIEEMEPKENSVSFFLLQLIFYQIDLFILTMHIKFECSLLWEWTTTFIIYQVMTK